MHPQNFIAAMSGRPEPRTLLGSKRGQAFLFGSAVTLAAIALGSTEGALALAGLTTAYIGGQSFTDGRLEGRRR